MPPKQAPKAIPSLGNPELQADFLANVLLAHKILGATAVGPLVAAVTAMGLPHSDAAPVDRGTFLLRDTPLGPLSVRALCAAVLSRGGSLAASGLKPKPYILLKRLLMHSADVQDDGAAAIAEMLRNGSLYEVCLEEVTLVACNIGIHGASALGSSLILGTNSHLTSLTLDCNTQLKDAGVTALARGLRTNKTLKRLALAVCGFGAEGAEELAIYLASPACVLESLDISGNDIGLEGLLPLAVASKHTRFLVQLLLCNCCISSTGYPALLTNALAGAVTSMGARGAATAAAVAAGGGAGGAAAMPLSLLGTSVIAGSGARGRGGVESMDITGGGGGGVGLVALAAATAAAGEGGGGITLGARAFGALGEALAAPTNRLSRVDLDGNPMTREDAAALVPGVAAAPAGKITMLRVPVTLPPEHFSALWRNVTAKAKKKGGVKKK